MKLTYHTIFQNKKMWSCGAASLTKYFRTEKEQRQIIYHFKGNLSEIPN